MRTRLPWIHGILLLVLLSACTHYTVGARSFRDKTEALSAHQQELVATLASVTPTDTPAGGSARIVLPSPERIAQSGILKQGNPAPEILDYVVTTQSRDLETMAAAVQKRSIFQEVYVERSAAVGDPSPGGADFLLWFHQPVPAAAQWYVSDSAMKMRREVPLDLSKPVGPERVNAWLAALERAVHRIQGTSKE